VINMNATTETVVETTANAIQVASFMNHLKCNRLEYALALIILHTLGVLDRVSGHLSGVCF
jgi:hypothetical protein